MARLITAGAELNSKTAAIEADVIANSTAITLDTATVRSGTYAWKFAPTAQAPGVTYIGNSAAVSTIGFGRAYVYFTTIPAVTAQIAAILNNGATARTAIAITSTGTLQLIGNAGTQIGSDSAAISTGHWYRIEIKHDGGAAKATEARYLDCGASGVDPGGAGTVIASGTNTGTVSWQRWKVGLFGTANSGVMYSDDIALNDDQGANQNTWCGSGRVIALRPDSAGDANGFLVNVGGTAGAGNNFTRVNEVTPDGTTTYNASAVLNAEDLFNCGASGIGATDTVNVVSVGGEYANTVSADATAAFKWEVEKTGSGTKTQSAAIIPNSTTMIVNDSVNTSASAFPIITYTDPDAAAWTQTTLDSMQIGYKETTANVQSIAISTVFALVDYTPVVVVTNKKLAALGVG